MTCATHLGKWAYLISAVLMTISCGGGGSNNSTVGESSGGSGNSNTNNNVNILLSLNDPISVEKILENPAFEEVPDEKKQTIASQINELKTIPEYSSESQFYVTDFGYKYVDFPSSSYLDIYTVEKDSISSISRINSSGPHGDYTYHFDENSLLPRMIYNNSDSTYWTVDAGSNSIAMKYFSYENDFLGGYFYFLSEGSVKVGYLRSNIDISSANISDLLEEIDLSSVITESDFMELISADQSDQEISSDTLRIAAVTADCAASRNQFNNYASQAAAGVIFGGGIGCALGGAVGVFVFEITVLPGCAIGALAGLYFYADAVKGMLRTIPSVLQCAIGDPIMEFSNADVFPPLCRATTTAKSSLIQARQIKSFPLSDGTDCSFDEENYFVGSCASKEYVCLTCGGYIDYDGDGKNTYTDLCASSGQSPYWYSAGGRCECR